MLQPVDWHRGDSHKEEPSDPEASETTAEPGVVQGGGSLLAPRKPTGKLEPHRLITHEYGLADMMRAYDTFEDAANQHALKVILHAP
jgi:hypothetical protein